MIEVVQKSTEIPLMETKDWNRNYSDVRGSKNLHNLFCNLRESGFHPFRMYHWPTRLWYVSDNYRPPALYMSEEEAESLTLEELTDFFERARSEWVWHCREYVKRQ